MISLIIALYNEERRLESLCGAAQDFLTSLGEPWELFLVDDGSRDGTPGLLRAAAALDDRIRVLTLERNQGQGAAIKRGMLESSGDVVLYCDADLPIPLSFFKTLIGHVRSGADAAVASRWMPGARIQTPQPAARRILGRAYYRLIGALFSTGIRDTNCGFKAYRGRIARELFAHVRSRRWAFNIEFLWLAERLGRSVLEVPVEWSHRDQSKVRVFRDCLFTLWELAAIQARRLTGSYPTR
ncbi:MAG: glycosyltransferase [Elusimicrobiota bacterium]|jgi:dolichyl-phosphate beta-glucosyltransferase